jgi:TolB protein
MDLCAATDVRPSSRRRPSAVEYFPQRNRENVSDATRLEHALSATLYGYGVFGLKLIACGFAGATVTLAIMNHLEGPQVATTFPADRFEALPQAAYPQAAYPQAGMHRQSTAGVEQEETVDYQFDRPVPSNYPRMVKTLRFERPQGSAPAVAALTTMGTPVAFKANGTSLEDMQRPDGSLKLRIPLHGSLQNPAWSPDGQSIAFTRFRNGYNKGPADVYVFNMATNTLRPVVADGSENVSQPGSTWSRNGQIVFSSDRGGHDEIWVASGDGSRPQKLTARSSKMAYEPSFAPDGQSVVIESHDVGQSGHGRITLFERGQSRYVDITGADEDCRQPNWSPRGDYILYQKHAGGRWDIWLYDLKTKQHRSATAALGGDKTDATFSPDGRFILYSGEAPGRSGESLLALPVEGGRPVPMTRAAGYHGAPSWSPDGAYLAMESSARSPDGTAGTELIITPVQSSVVRMSFDAR